MGKVAKALTAIEVGRLEEPGYHAVGTVPGLYLQVTPGGAKSWVMALLMAQSLYSTRGTFKRQG